MKDVRKFSQRLAITIHYAIVNPQGLRTSDGHVLVRGKPEGNNLHIKDEVLSSIEDPFNKGDRLILDNLPEFEKQLDLYDVNYCLAFDI